MTEDEARQRLIELVAQDIESHGWTIKKVSYSEHNSTYIRCRRKSLEMTVRISDHPPNHNLGACGLSIHPGGKQRKHLLRRLNRKPKEHPTCDLTNPSIH